MEINKDMVTDILTLTGLIFNMLGALLIYRHPMTPKDPYVTSFKSAEAEKNNNQLALLGFKLIFIGFIIQFFALLVHIFLTWWS